MCLRLLAVCALLCRLRFAGRSRYLGRGHTDSLAEEDPEWDALIPNAESGAFPDIGTRLTTYPRGVSKPRVATSTFAHLLLEPTCVDSSNGLMRGQVLVGVGDGELQVLRERQGLWRGL